MQRVNTTWLRNPWLTWDSEALQTLRHELDAYLVSIRALRESCTTPSAVSVLENLVKEALTRIVSLKTALRAYESMNPHSSSMIAAQTELLEKWTHVITLWEAIQNEHPIKGADTTPTPNPGHIALERLTPTLNAMHRHLFSQFRIEVSDTPTQMRHLSYSQTLQILKSSDDAALRKSVWRASNAWCSQHRLLFTDLLNLTLAVKVPTAYDENTLLEQACHEESIRPDTYHALFDALESTKTTLQQSISLRAQAQGLSHLPVHELLSVRPPSSMTPSDFGSYESTVEHIQSAYSALDPDFKHFIEPLHEQQWVDARLHSNKAGGTWCENFPATKHVAVFANFSTGLAGAMQLAHPFAVGYLYHLHHQAGQFVPRVPYSILEIAGEIGMAQTLRHYSASLTADQHTLLWYQLRSLTNKLLWLPMRHQLMKSLLLERSRGPLTSERINDLVKQHWAHWFGDTVDGVDAYYWALKPHFFRTDVLCYDWQYTLGFLLARKVLLELEGLPAEERQRVLREFLVNLGNQPLETVTRTLFHWDLGCSAFWKAAIGITIEPVQQFHDLEMSQGHRV